METQIQSPIETRPSPVERAAPPAADMRMVLDDIRVSINAARRQEHDAAHDSRFKPLLAESSESTRLKARLSGLWNRMEYNVGEGEQIPPPQSH
jgi:hypothetical protein